MPIYMVQHITKNKKAKDIAEAYYLKLQNKYNGKCINCWSDDKKNSVFYLIETSNKQSVNNLYEDKDVSSLVPHKITLLDSNLVDALVNRDRKSMTNNEDDHVHAKIYSDPSYRAFFITKITNTRLLQHVLGIHKAHQLIALQEQTIYNHIKASGGHEIESEEEGIIASFTSSCQAIDCAASIQKTLKETAKLVNLRIGIHAGLPDNKSKVPHKNIIKLANYFCGIADNNQIVVSSFIHELYTEDEEHKIMGVHDRIRWLFPCEGEFLTALMDTVTNNFHNPKFNIKAFCNAMSMSKSQLYRQCKALTSVSINELLREFRLLKALEILNKTDSNINQTAFDTGFNSVSYFSKCFKNRFGLSPKAFLKKSVAT